MCHSSVHFDYENKIKSMNDDLRNWNWFNGNFSNLETNYFECRVDLYGVEWRVIYVDCLREYNIGKI